MVTSAQSVTKAKRSSVVTTFETKSKNCNDFEAGIKVVIRNDFRFYKEVLTEMKKHIIQSIV